MVARDGVEPPPPAFSGLVQAELTTTYRFAGDCQVPANTRKPERSRAEFLVVNTSCRAPEHVLGQDVEFHLFRCFDFCPPSCGLPQNPFSQTRRAGHAPPSVHGIGHGPTKPTGADANSDDEPLAQNRSTGRPSHPQRPPGSKHALPPGKTHVPYPSQPFAPVNPQRRPEGHSESLLHLAPLSELRILRVSVASAVGAAGMLVEWLPHAVSSHNPATNAALPNLNVCIAASPFPFRKNPTTARDGTTERTRNMEQGNSRMV
jgi:hypothetical protein